jgi:hypothetical protein
MRCCETTYTYKGTQQQDRFGTKPNDCRLLIADTLYLTVAKQAMSPIKSEKLCFSLRFKYLTASRIPASFATPLYSPPPASKRVFIRGPEVWPSSIPSAILVNLMKHSTLLGCRMRLSVGMIISLGLRRDLDISAIKRVRHYLHPLAYVVLASYVTVYMTSD